MYVSVCVQITFTGRNVGAVSVDYFYAKAVGCPSRSVVKCIASCTGLFVNLSTVGLCFVVRQ